jgi:hypothetical protein
MSSADRISLLLKSAERSLSFVQKPAKLPTLTIEQDSRIAELADQLDLLQAQVSKFTASHSSALERRLGTLEAKVGDLGGILERRIAALEVGLNAISTQIDRKIETTQTENLVRMEGLAKAVGKSLRTDKTYKTSAEERLTLAAMRAELNEYARRFEAISQFIKTTRENSFFCVT